MSYIGPLLDRQAEAAWHVRWPVSMIFVLKASKDALDCYPLNA